MCWMAIRENQLPRHLPGLSGRTLQARCLRISAVVTGLAGALLAFQTYLVSAEAVFGTVFRRIAGDGW